MDEQEYFGFQFRDGHIQTIKDGIANGVIVPLSTYKQPLFVIEYPNNQGKSYMLSTKYINMLIDNVDAYLTYNVPPKVRSENKSLIDFMKFELRVQNSSTESSLHEYCQKYNLPGAYQASF